MVNKVDKHEAEANTLKALRHCARKECYACPYRHDPDCIPRVTGEANQIIERLQKELAESHAVS